MRDDPVNADAAIDTKVSSDIMAAPPADVNDFHGNWGIREIPWRPQTARDARRDPVRSLGRHTQSRAGERIMSRDMPAARGPSFASLTGHTAVVTGSSSGIGRAVARELSRGGANLVIHCRESLEPAQRLAAELEDAGGQAVIVPADLEDSDQLEAFVERCWTVLGPVDIWVNNAGVDLLTGPAARLSYAEKLDLLLHVDVRSTLLLSRHVGNRMRNRGGTILNIGWDQADRGMEGDSGELFATAKNAIMGATRSLAVSYAPTVRVNCIAPGWIRTAWGEQAGPEWQARVRRETPLQRWGTPDDIATMARFLVSPTASYITGQVINVNGGAVR